MTTIRRLLTALVSLAALATLVVGAPAAAAGGRDASLPTFTVEGRVAEPLTLTVEDLREEFEQELVAAEYRSRSGAQGHVYRGALLIDVLRAAEPRFDPEVNNAALRYAVLVTATDGYQAVVSWGEIDPHYAGTDVLLAYSEDGRPLQRPRLVVPGDERGGRYVFDVARVSLLRVAP